MTKRIIIMAGGTGGHIFPALAVAQFLQKQDWKVSWIGTKAGLENRIIPENGIEINWISVSGIRGKGWLNKLIAIVKFVKSCFEVLAIFRSQRPDIVLGMGGFIAAPGGLMAKMLGIPLIIHEQNRIVGTTNKFLAKIATKVLQGFPDSFPKQINAICTGNPLRENLQQAAVQAQFFSILQSDKLKLLIIGGSQGAKALNESIPSTIALLKSSVHVWHQTGTVMQEEVAAQYEKLKLSAEVCSFIEDMAAAYLWADLIICRAGAMTVSEVAAMGIPAIFIPLPNAIDDHQTANAQYLTDTGAAILLKQNDLKAKTLAQQIEILCQNLPKRRAIAQTVAYLNATETVASIIIKEVDHEFSK